MTLLFLLLLATPAICKNVFVSSPFDNFRIECPKRAAATELSVRMVESVGQKRQDVVFDLSCETIDDLYPWINIPVGISDIEREDCHYSEMIDPILDENTTYTCAPREYLAGITRLSDTRIQTMCCKLRSRDEFNCKDLVFNKPIGLTRSTLIEHDNQLINAIRIKDRNYIVRFCDLAPRATAAIMTDEKIRQTTTSAPSTLAPIQKQDPLKVVKTKPLRTPQHPPPRAKSVPVATFENPTLPLIELPNDANDISKVELPQFVDTTTPRPSTKPLVIVTLPTTTKTTTTTTTEQPTTTEEVIEEETTSAFEESTFPQETPIFSPQLVEDIVRKIGSAQDEQKAAQIFQQSLNKLLQNANEKPIEQSSAILDNGAPAARPPSDLEIHFDDSQFPQPNNNRKTMSKELLPLRKNSESGSLQPLNMDGRRRSPIRTHRPHVDIWDSDEDDEETEKIMSEINGSVEMHEPSTTKAPKKVIKKIIKKVIRGHRNRGTIQTTTPTTTTTTTTTEPSTTTTTTTTTTPEPRKTTKKLESSFFGSIEQDIETERRVTPGPRRFRGRTTTPSARRDLPVQRKISATRMNQIDNARDIDEETELSPFDDPTNIESTTQSTPIEHKKSVVEAPKIEFQEDEDIEEVISKLSVRRADIRRAPVRNSLAEAQFSEKVVVPKQKDGVKTHIGQIPIKMPMMESISTSNLDNFDDQDDESDLLIEDIEKGDINDSEIEDITEKIEQPVTFPTRATRPTTTQYDPSVFYHTIRPRPMKKESILRFCSKESAIRDGANMVIACGLDQDIWTPNRCPENADCFPSHDSLYRICCPVHRG